MSSSAGVLENLSGNCITSWAVRLNDIILQIPYIGIASKIIHNKKNIDVPSERLLSEYCGELFGCNPDNFLRAIKLLGESYMLIQHFSAIGWTGMKDSMPAPKEFVKNQIKKIKKDGKVRRQLCRDIEKGLKNVAQAIKYLTEFNTSLRGHFFLAEYWYSAAQLLLRHLILVKTIIDGNISNSKDLSDIATFHKAEYKTFLERHETSASAAKNASLIFDPIIEFVRHIKNKKGEV